MLPIKLSFCMMQLLFFKVPYQPMGKICRPLYTPVMILIRIIVPFAVILWFKNHAALLSRPAWYDSAAVHAIHPHQILRHEK